MPPNPSESNLDVSQVFPSLFGRRIVKDSAQWNGLLEKRILERQSTTPSEDYANSGGWHSPADLLEAQGQDIDWLRGIIAEGTSNDAVAGGQVQTI